jgi:DNA-binding CsgD family transcriptional regulator
MTGQILGKRQQVQQSAVGQVLEAAVAAVDPAEFAVAILPPLAAEVGCDSLAYLDPGPLPDWSGQVRLTVPTDFMCDEDWLLFERFNAEGNYPLLAHTQGAGDGSPLRTSDVLTRRAYHALGIYSGLLRHLEVEYQLAVSLPVSSNQHVCLAFNRSSRDFGQRELELLDERRQLLAAILRHLEHTALTRRFLTALEAATEADGLGVLLLDKRGRLEQANPTGYELAGRPDVDRRRFPLSPGDGQLVVLRAKPDPPNVEMYDLTARESEILLMVAEGRTNTQVAKVFGISPRTVHKHLEHIYRKLAVSSRTEATARLLQPRI